MPDKTRTKSKPQLRRIPSDDFVTRDGEYPHVGESVWIKGRPTLALLRADWSFRLVGAELDAVKPEPQAEGESDKDFLARLQTAHEDAVRISRDHHTEIEEWVAKRIVKWDWTNDDDEPLPPLDGTPAPFEEISDDELFYLWKVAKGEAPAEVGEGGNDSPATSSATESMAKPT